jgi:hypothetical protein
LNDLWGGVFGIPKVGDYVSESENVNEDILKLGRILDTDVLLISPHA